MAASKEQDKETGGKINTPGPDNPAYSKKDSGGEGGGEKQAFDDGKHIWNNQILKQESPKITEKEAKYGEPPSISADDAKKLSDVRDQFAPNADKPTTASDNNGKKLPEIMQNVDPQQMMQMLPQMFKKMSKVRDQMNMAVPSSGKNIFQDAFTGALKIVTKKYGYDQTILTFNNTFDEHKITEVVEFYRDIVQRALANLVEEAVFYGPDDIQANEYENIYYGDKIPPKVVTYDEVPDGYIKHYYDPVDLSPYPGYIRWENYDVTDVLWVKRTAKDIPATSATQEAYTSAELDMAEDLDPYIKKADLSISELNDILTKNFDTMQSNGLDNSLGKGTGNNNNKNGGGGGGQQMQKLLGKLQPVVDKFKQQMLGGGGGGSQLSELGIGIESILDVSKGQEAIKKFTENMGNINGMEKNAQGAFGMFNMDQLQNLQSQLGQFMNQKGGGGGGGNQNQGQQSSQQQNTKMSYNQLSNSNDLLQKLQDGTKTQ